MVTTGIRVDKAETEVNGVNEYTVYDGISNKGMSTTAKQRAEMAFTQLMRAIMNEGER